MSLSATTSSTRRRVCVEIDRTDLEAAMRHVVVDAGRFVVGRVRRRHERLSVRLLIDRLQPVDGIPSGDTMPALVDWAVLTCRHTNETSARALPTIVDAARSQLLVCVCLNHTQRERLDVVVWDRGTLVPVDRLRISGSGGFELPEPSPEDRFDITPTRRLFLSQRDSRTAGAVGDRLLSGIRQSCVAIVGAGGGGSALSMQLASFRPRRMLVFDADHVGPENLNAMPHAAESDAEHSRLKVETLAAAIEANQPDIQVNGLPWSITESRSIQLLETIHVDAFFSFVDTDTARLCTSHLARAGHAVHVDTGTRIQHDDNDRLMHGDIRLFEPGQGRGCVLCVPEMRAEQREEAFYNLNAPAGSLYRGQPVAWDDPARGRAGSLLLLNTVAASLAVDLWLAWLDGRVPTSHWRRIMWPFGQPPQVESIDVTGVPGCAFCGDSV